MPTCNGQQQHLSFFELFLNLLQPQQSQQKQQQQSVSCSLDLLLDLLDY